MHWEEKESFWIEVPHHTIHLAKPWMNHYYVLLKDLVVPFNILIHEMLADDRSDGVHNHTFHL